MTDNEINVAISETMGFTVGDLSSSPTPAFCITGKDGVDWKVHEYAKLFDFVNDLNVIHFAVNTLATERKEAFLAYLAGVLDAKNENDDRWLPAKIIESTPRDWCKAFLRAVGKWKE